MTTLPKMNKIPSCKLFYWGDSVESVLLDSDFGNSGQRLHPVVKVTRYSVHKQNMAQSNRTRKTKRRKS
jgi:hypothetical protein